MPRTVARTGTSTTFAAAATALATGPGSAGASRTTVAISASARPAASMRTSVNVSGGVPPGSRIRSTASPDASAAWQVSQTSARESPTTATRRPAGSGWAVSSSATSKPWEIRSTLITPVWRSNASSRGERPLVTTTTGVRRPTRRASRANFRGLPKVSTCMKTTSVAGSSSQNCRRSLPLTSTRSPAETKQDSPTPRAAAASSSAAPSGPDCE